MWGTASEMHCGCQGHSQPAEILQGESKKKKKIKTLTLPPPFPQISCQCSPVSWSKVERVERMVGGGRVVDRKCTAHNLKETSKCNQVEFYR